MKYLFLLFFFLCSSPLNATGISRRAVFHLDWGNQPAQILRGWDECGETWYPPEFAVGPNGEVAIGDAGGFIKLFDNKGKFINAIPTEWGGMHEFAFDSTGSIYFHESDMPSHFVIKRWRKGNTETFFEMRGQLVQLNAVNSDGQHLYIDVYRGPLKSMEWLFCRISFSNTASGIECSSVDTKTLDNFDPIYWAWMCGNLFPKSLFKAQVDPIGYSDDKKHIYVEIPGKKKVKPISELVLYTTKGVKIGSCLFEDWMLVSRGYRQGKYGMDRSFYVTNNRNEKRFTLWKIVSINKVDAVGNSVR